MLWSLIKVVLFFCIVAALAWGAGQLLNADGAIRVAMADVEFTLGPLQAVIAAILLVVAVWVVLKILGLLVAILRFLNGDETAVTRYLSRNREKKGLNALGDAMLALASGEGRVAQSKAEKADKYLKRPELTDLLIAQGAEMTGDTRKAEDVYKRLLADDRTRFVGVRGLLKHKLDAGDTETSLALAREAFSLKPKHEETQDTLLRLQASQHDWAGARQTLGAKLKSGNMPRDVHKRRDAVLALSEAREVLDEGASIDAREAAIEANRLSPDLIPAAALAARGYIARNQERYATRVLKKAWDAQPHPDIAAAFAAIAPEETAQQRIRRFQTLARLKPDHPETKMLMAELHIANEDFPAARRALGDLATTDPTARSVTIMAAIERGEGADDAIVRGWLTRALSVPRGPQWVCNNCQTVHAEWAPICGSCSAFDTFSWREPQEGVVAMPAQSDMLPLIVGQIGQPAPDVATAETAAAPETGTDSAEAATDGTEAATDGKAEVPDAAGTDTASPPPEPDTRPVETAPPADVSPQGPVPPVSEDRKEDAVTVPEAEVIVPQHQRDDRNRAVNG